MIFYLAFSICMLVLFTGGCMTINAGNYFVDAEAESISKEAGCDSDFAAAFARFFIYCYYFTSVVCVLLVSMWVLGHVMGQGLISGASL